MAASSAVLPLKLGESRSSHHAFDSSHVFCSVSASPRGTLLLWHHPSIASSDRKSSHPRKLSLPGHLSLARISSAKLDHAMRPGLWFCRFLGEVGPRRASASKRGTDRTVVVIRCYRLTAFRTRFGGGFWAGSPRITRYATESAGATHICCRCGRSTPAIRPGSKRFRGLQRARIRQGCAVKS